jgi:hypothetical protein
MSAYKYIYAVALSFYVNGLKMTDLGRNMLPHYNIYIYIILDAREIAMGLACPFRISKAKQSYVFPRAGKGRRCHPRHSTKTLKCKSIVVLMHAMNEWTYSTFHS